VRLKSELERHTAILEATRAQYEADNRRHEQELAMQRALISSLHTRKVRQDAVIDAALGAVSLTLVNTALVEMPIAVVLMLVPRSRVRAWLRQALKASVALALVRYVDYSLPKPPPRALTSPVQGFTEQKFTVAKKILSK
jgi:hypothetical protein